MQSFNFAPPAQVPRENQKTFVFVDEQNRHKRLKVMRACEGCRRRKIKCDAATTNTWPCSACVRLKLNCIPPTISYEKDSGSGTFVFDLERPQSYDGGSNGSLSGEDDLAGPQPPLPPAPMSAPVGPSPPPFSQAYTSNPLPRTYHDDQYLPPLTSHSNVSYGNMPQQVPVSDSAYTSPSVYPTPTTAGAEAAVPEDREWRTDMATQNLSKALGELKIDHTAVAPYIANHKTLAETPALEEVQLHIPDHHSADSVVRIPPSMMPTENQAMRYFEYFFSHIHPYVPVLNRPYFYQHWHTGREKISPLILEGIFACSSRMLDEPAEADKWLALFAKHEESFRDVPRISTIQAFLLILKAREAVPKRGYYYRSWTTIANLVLMAKDLELHEHHEIHQMGRSCGSSVYDCSTKYRVWHTLFVVELMIGAPQGRHNFGVPLDSVDFSVARLPGLDDGEAQISRQFSYLLQLIKDIRGTNQLYSRLSKKKKDWPLDPEFMEHSHVFAQWTRSLPRDLHIALPQDGSTPWIPSHYVANLHSYYHLAVVMHHRPQFQFRMDFNDTWKQHMCICYASAKTICRLQEAILQHYGLPGLLCMQRGVNFTIYAVMTCTILHLVAITSPDPELNADAREYFTRHMRIMEQCINAWPMPEVQLQINSLREAFSADLAKPFELKPSFPYNSPVNVNHPSPPNDYRPAQLSTHDPSSLDQPGQVYHNAHPITPPISAGDADSKADSPAAQSLMMMATGQRHAQQIGSIPISEPSHWNPSRIFDQWNTAFGTSSTNGSATQSSPPHKAPGPTSAGFATLPQDPSQPSFSSVSSVGSGSPHGSQMHHSPTPGNQRIAYGAAPQQSYVTPTMWQDVVAGTLQGGQKRSWDYSNPAYMDPMAQKRRG
ncbi:hypothetical protein EV356DRAFT_446659 [Viridothelium virens]|uniref:Zn(2)-C6 fungal-type domain-containing protein n=1 Tax=Viridothelium virens TaxID=1048519 RepID=A0A6A6HAG1_VIRVR|nr:hypothetical protein EV356DRAFT_446659 [Viridothelium virens]